MKSPQHLFKKKKETKKKTRQSETEARGTQHTRFNNPKTAHQHFIYLFMYFSLLNVCRGRSGEASSLTLKLNSRAELSPKTGV